jgi:hypothetical protein
MRPVALVTDSTADLSMELRKKHDIYSIPLYVLFKDETYADGIDLDPKKLYQLVLEKQMIPKTAAVSPGDFLRFFEPLVQKGYDILYLGIGSSLSATFQSARIAKSEFPPGRITLVDSKNLSSGIGLLVLKAKDMRDRGMSASEIKEELDKLVPRVRSYFAIRTLDYLGSVDFLFIRFVKAISRFLWYNKYRSFECFISKPVHLFFLLEASHAIKNRKSTSSRIFPLKSHQQKKQMVSSKIPCSLARI